MTTQLGAGRGWLTDAAARSIARLDHVLGHPMQITEAGRTWAQQNVHFQAYRRYLAGGSWAPIALDPNAPSIHQLGNAIDTDEGQQYVGLLAEHGWKRTVYRNGVLVEPWHFEYSTARDRHLNDPAPTTALEDDMTAHVKLYLHKPTNKLLLVDHLNKTIRDLGDGKDDRAWERRQFDQLDKVWLSDAEWTKAFKDFSYITKPNLAPGVN